MRHGRKLVCTAVSVLHRSSMAITTTELCKLTKSHVKHFSIFGQWTLFKENPALRVRLQTNVEKLTEAYKTVHETRRKFPLKLEPMETVKLLHKFDKSHKEQPICQGGRMYMRQVLALPQFQACNP